MKRKALITIFMLSLSIAIFAQKIKISETDKFDKTRRIETTEVRIPTAFMMSFRSVNETIFLNIVRGESMVVGPDSKLIFLLDSDKTVEVFPKEIQSAKYTGSSSYNTFIANLEYVITKEDIQLLKNHTILSVRMHSTENYRDMEINGKSSEKINKLSEIFLGEFLKFY